MNRIGKKSVLIGGRQAGNGLVCRLVLASLFLLLGASPAFAQYSVFGLGSSSARNVGAGATAAPLPTQPPEAMAEEAPEEVMPENGLPALEPFGASLFAEGGAAGVAPLKSEQPITVGDRIHLRLFGALDQETMAVVDPDGNIFVPTIGPVSVVGTPSQSISDTISREVQRVYRDNVSVYAVVLEPGAVSVFVTGDVERPGRYSGSYADSVVDYLRKAGGITPGTGSYRSVKLLRDGRVIEELDLYEFLLQGHLGTRQLTEGDTLLVGEQMATIDVLGAVRRSFRFEMRDDEARSAKILELARPLPSATTAEVRGVRDGSPFIEIVPLSQFASFQLRDRDVITFIEDGKTRDVGVSVSGSHYGPSHWAVDPTVTLKQLLDHVPVDPATADLGGIYVNRPSVAERQKQILDSALSQLERTALTALSNTLGESGIRSQEAQLVLQFISRARDFEPEGTVVVFDDAGQLQDLTLKSGDEVVIPQKSDLVLVGGEVTVPQTIVFDAEYDVDDYIRLAGGATERSSASILVRHPNGFVEVSTSPTIRPGDFVIVLPDVDIKGFQLFKDFIEVISQIAVSARVLLLL